MEFEVLPSLSLGACLGFGLLCGCDSTDAMNCCLHSSTILAQVNKSSNVSSGQGSPNFSHHWLTRLEKQAYMVKRDPKIVLVPVQLISLLNSILMSQYDFLLHFKIIGKWSATHSKSGFSWRTMWLPYYSAHRRIYDGFSSSVLKDVIFHSCI